MRRAKSKAYIFGSLRRRHPSAPEATVRDLVEGLRHLEWPTLDIGPTRRAPIKGREPLSAPCWEARVAELLGAVSDAPGLTSGELFGRLRARLRWGHNYAVQVVAAAEERRRIEYRQARWVPLVLAPANVFTGPRWVSQALPPELTPATPAAPQLALFALPSPVTRPARKRRQRATEQAATAPAQLSLFEWRPSSVVELRPRVPLLAAG